MKKTIALLLAAVMLLSLAACGAKQPQSTGGQTESNEKSDTSVSNPFANVEIKTSPDKYTWYIKNYVGKNLASIGYTSMGGDRMDSYGNGYIQLILRTPNGEYVDIHNEDDLKNWRVIGQSLEPNTEIKYTYQVDSDGEEYDNLIAYQNIEEIVLALAPVGGDADVPEMTAINTTADRCTLFIREYVGRNLTQCGYTSMGGDRMDAYGSAYVHLALVSTNGDFVDIQNEESMKNWVVVAQNIVPNTELKLTYQLDEDGNEYDNLISYQNIEEIVLAVAPVGEAVEIPSLTAISPSPDRYTNYIRDYTGRTLAQCGYISMAGKLMDQYGAAYIHLVICADDGSFVDIHDDSALKNYVVTSQSIDPNSELKMTYSVDSEGNEYENLIDTQNIEEIELYVTRMNSYSSEPEEAEATEPSEEMPTTESGEGSKLIDGLRPEFKEAMDAYEDFYGEYCDFMVKYKENTSDLALLVEYADIMERAVEMDEAFQAWEDEDLNNEELKYYLEVNNRVMQMLVDVME